jgi:NADH:ubiquinone oxidoreductase subunit E
MLWEKHREPVEAILAQYPVTRSAVLPLLRLAQKIYGHCTNQAVREIAGILHLDPTEERSVVGFYTLFFEREMGRRVIQICDDLPCALRGADRFVDHMCKKLNLDPDQVRHGGQITKDGQFTVETVMCVAACDRAPVIQIDLDYFEKLTEQGFNELVSKLNL